MYSVLRLAALTALTALVLAVPASAQLGPRVQSASGELALPPDATVEPFDTEAAAIIQYDDGEVDRYLAGSASVSTFELAMRFDAIGGTDITLGGIDVCLRQSGSDAKIRYEVVVWAADGPGGSPGAELAHYAAVADGVTATPSFHSTSFNYPLTTPTVYLGVRYNPVVDPDFWFCVDEDGTTVHPGYFRLDEGAAWADVLAVAPAYNAFMVRAYVSTPGVFLESLLVPSYLVDTLSPGGTTSLFAVRNLTSGTVEADVEYFDVLGVSLRTDSFTLGPDETHTANVRDVDSLPADADGYARGYIEISTAGDPHMTPVLGGDFFQVDVDDNFATGDKLVRRLTDLCTESSIRYLAFPFADSGTRLTVWIATPRGTAIGDPESFTLRIFDEAGNQLGSPYVFYTSAHIVELHTSDFPGISFGFMRFDFTNSFGGVVYSEAQAGGRFSVGMTGQCYEAP